MRKIPSARAVPIATNRGKESRSSSPDAGQTPATPGRRLATILVLLCLVTLAAYARTLVQDFINYDDPGNFYENPHLNPAPDLSFGPFLHPYFQMYIPVTYTVFALLSLAARMARPDPQITMSGGSLDPRAFHGFSLFLHLTNVVLVLFLLRRLLAARRNERPEATDWAAGAGALVFALHPVQVESVAWASQMRGLLSGTFSLAALLVYLSGSPRRAVIYGMAIILGVLAVLSKPSAVTLPLAALALDRLVNRQSWKDSLLPVLIWIAAVGPFVWIAGRVQPTPPAFGGPLWGRFFVLGDALAFYAGKLVWPVSLGADYGRTPSVVLSHWWGYVTWLVPAAIALFAYAQRRHRPWVVTGVVVTFAFLLPVLGLTPFIFQQFSTVADRYLYLALLGPAMLASFALQAAGASALEHPSLPGKTVIGAACLVGAAFFFLTVRQVATWDDSVTAMSQTLRVNPRSFNGQLNLGSALLALGKGKESVSHLQTAASLKPGDVQAKTALGLCLLQLGRIQEALSQLRVAVAIAPDDAAAHNALGLADLIANQPDRAIPEFRAAVALHPGMAASYDHLGRALEKTGDESGAAAAYRQALQIDPLLIPVYSRLGDALSATGRFPEAITAYADCLKRDPTSIPAYKGLIQADIRTGNRAAAIAALATALAYNPSDTEAKALRALIDQAPRGK